MVIVWCFWICLFEFGLLMVEVVVFVGRICIRFIDYFEFLFKFDFVEVVELIFWGIIC